MKSANLKVKACLDWHGFEFEIRLLPEAVRTARLAADALGWLPYLAVERKGYYPTPIADILRMDRDPLVSTYLLFGPLSVALGWAGVGVAMLLLRMGVL